MGLMRPEDYPAQDAVSEFAQSYTDDLLRRVDPNAGENFFYGDDPYQSIALFRPKRPTLLRFPSRRRARRSRRPRSISRCRRRCRPGNRT